ncbi:uncharacterized protein B0H18DRAFT_65160 [Fomitopsis serialis]|uniref:uncharacterized protein n=1 Tax=Fomitopsis serialis TaxID=139415 RepID=UPI002007CA05|nr:uncharacterized protein B0H18DRAFT_65160 [Neoantrodia serialis]KAH9916470.1 hypothetical protein B0H18DRAFT_65160 [Neoantrodia serialis]
MQHILSAVSSSISGLPFVGAPKDVMTSAQCLAQQLMNYDLWYRVTTYLSVEDARTLSMVCRECHAAAIRRSMSFVKPTNKDQLRAMCSSMTIGKYYRASLLSELRIERKAFGALSFSTVWVPYHFDKSSPIPGDLAALLGQTVNLRVLSLQCVEDLIEANASVGDALVGLERLDTLELMDIGEKTFAVAMRIPSRPTKLTLSYETHDSTRSDLRHLSQLPLLERARVLDLRQFRLADAPVNANLDGASLIHPWPATEELCLTFCAYLPFRQLFPNLRTLSMWRICEMTHADMSFVQWPSSVPLKHVTGDQQNVMCVWGTPVRWLDLKTYFPDSISLLRSIRETVPVVLSMLCPQDDMHDAEFWESLVAAVTTPQARLRYLMLTIKFDQSEGLRWLQKMVPLLSTTRLLSIRLIVIDLDYTPPVDNGREDVWHGDPDRVPSHWQTFFRQVHGSLARAIPSLRLISVLFVGRMNVTLQAQYDDDYDGEFSWWRVVDGDGGERECASVQPDVGEKIHRHLLSDEFERRLDFDDQMLLEGKDTS